MAALDLYAPRALSDLRIHVRAETHLVDAGARLIAAIKRHKIGYVVFNDRLDEGHDMRLLAPANFALWARRVGKQPEELARNMDQARLRGREVPRHLCGLAEAFDDLGVLYGSHNDRDGETRERYCMIGARIAEFPATRQAARAARAMMCPVILGAPNVLRGTSQSGNVSAVDFVAEGLCDALASDCHTPALALAAWALVDRGLATLPKAWAMISTKPAEIMRMPDRGRLAPGMRADLVVVNSETRIIEATISAGKLSYLAGEAGRRFLSSPQIMRMAAE